MEPIEVVDYDPTWPAQFAELAARIRAAFADGPPIAVEHVGSTAVAGLAAKPIIDLNVIVPSREDVTGAIARLAALGYVHQGDLGIAGREAFRSPSGPPSHHLYLCAEGSAELRRHLAFRDTLRAAPDMAGQYAALKRTLAERHGADRSAYSEAKSEFIAGILDEARV